MSIGQRIKTMRLEQGLSIDDLAYKVGKNRTTIYRYENGDIENLPLGILDSLANALNTTPAYLMGWEGPNIDAHSDFDRIVVERLYKWREVFEPSIFNDDEFRKILEYARFLISIREN